MVRDQTTGEGRTQRGKTAHTVVLGPVSGLVAGVVLFDDGPGVEPMVVVPVVLGACATAFAEARTGRGLR